MTPHSSILTWVHVYVSLSKFVYLSVCVCPSQCVCVSHSVRLCCCVCVSIFQCVCDTFSAALNGLEGLLALDALSGAENPMSTLGCYILVKNVHSHQVHWAGILRTTLISSLPSEYNNQSL